MDDPLKARLRLYLRSERALGLSAVPAAGEPAPIAEEDPGEPMLETSARPEPPQPRLPVKSPAQQAPAKTLFAGDPQAGLAAEGLIPPPTSGAFAGPPLSTQEKRARLIAMDEKEVRGCTKCRLCETRTHT